MYDGNVYAWVIAMTSNNTCTVVNSAVLVMMKIGCHHDICRRLYSDVHFHSNRPCPQHFGKEYDYFLIDVFTFSLRWK